MENRETKHVLNFGKECSLIYFTHKIFNLIEQIYKNFVFLTLFTNTNIKQKTSVFPVNSQFEVKNKFFMLNKMLSNKQSFIKHLSHIMVQK